MQTTLIINPDWDAYIEDVTKDEHDRLVERHAEILAGKCHKATDTPWTEVAIMEPHEVATWKTLHPGDTIVSWDTADDDGPWADWFRSAVETAWEEVS